MAESAPQKELNKAEKAAVLLLCMDEKTTGDLFNQLKDDEIRKVGNALLNLRQIPALQIQKVIEEFSKGVYEKKTMAAKAITGDVEIDGKKAMENLLNKSLNANRGQYLLSSMGQATATVVEEGGDFGEFVKQLSADDLYEMVNAEYPQVVALTLSHTKRKTAKDVIEKFPEAAQVDILSRMARLEKIPGRSIEDIRSYMDKKIKEKSTQGVDTTVKKVEAKEELSIEGMSGTVLLLKSLKRDQSAKLLEQIEQIDADLAALIGKQMFTIEDLERADDMGIRELLRSVTNDELKVALKNSPDTIKEKIFKNMSERAAMILREDMEVLPPLKVEDIEQAQEKVLKRAKELIKEDKLKLTEVPDEGDA